MESKLSFIKDNLDEIKDMIKNNVPLSEMCRKFKIKQETLQKHLKNLGIFYKGNQSLKGKTRKSQRVDINEYLTNKKRINASRLKFLLIREKMKEEKCEKCGRTEWEGDKIPLELHHIDGNHFNNEIENLMILCPNCHMQIHGFSNVKK